VTELQPILLEIFSEDIRIKRIDLELNMRRFYRMHIQPDLFGGAILIKEWGRIGTTGRQLAKPYDDAGQAIDALLAHLKTNKRRGYVQA